MSESVLPMVSILRVLQFGVLHLGLIHFEFISLYGVRKSSSFFLLHVVDHFPQHHVLITLGLRHCIFVPPLSKITCAQVCGFISGFSILFHSSISLSLCQYYTALMTVALQYSLKSARLIPPVPFFFPEIALGIWSLQCFHTNCEIICSSSVKNTSGSSIGIVRNLQIALGSRVIFTILILPIQERGTFLHLFVSSLISFIKFFFNRFLYTGLCFFT